MRLVGLSSLVFFAPYSVQAWTAVAGVSRALPKKASHHAVPQRTFFPASRSRCQDTVSLSARGQVLPRRRRRSRASLETLVAKGIAASLLVRVAASSPVAALAAAFALVLLIISPVVAIEALLLAGLLMLTGAASYWPANIVAVGLGGAGIAGVVHGVIVRWEELSAARRPARKRGQRRAASPPAGGSPPSEAVDDGSGSLVALLVSALTAAVFGALP